MKKRIIVLSTIVTGSILISVLCHNSPNNILKRLYQYPEEKNNVYKNYTYDIYADHINIISYNGSSKRLRIPRYIDGKPVLSIEDSAFYGNDYLEEVIISDTVVKIGHQSFIGCKNLKEIYIPKTVVYIGSSAFDNCPSLEAIYIGNNSKQRDLLKKYSIYIKYN